MLGMAFLFGGLTGGLSAHKQQHDINKTACGYFDTITAYKEASITMLTQDNYMLGTYKENISEINDSVTDLMNSIRTKRQEFKNKYNLYVIVLTIFILLIIFILVTKKIIYHAHTE